MSNNLHWDFVIANNAADPHCALMKDDSNFLTLPIASQDQAGQLAKLLNERDRLLDMVQELDNYLRAIRAENVDGSEPILGELLEQSLELRTECNSNELANQATSQPSDRAKFTYLDLAQFHVSEATSHWLDEAICTGLAIAPYEYGAFVSVPANNDAIDELECPDDLKAVLKYAHFEGCGVVRFDADADAVAALPTFDWNC